MRKRKPVVDAGDIIMYNHLPEIKHVKTNYAVLIALAIITAVSITYFQFSGMSDSFTDYLANIYSWWKSA